MSTTYNILAVDSNVVNQIAFLHAIKNDMIDILSLRSTTSSSSFLHQPKLIHCTIIILIFCLFFQSHITKQCLFTERQRSPYGTVPFSLIILCRIQAIYSILRGSLKSTLLEFGSSTNITTAYTFQKEYNLLVRRRNASLSMTRSAMFKIISKLTNILNVFSLQRIVNNMHGAIT